MNVLEGKHVMVWYRDWAGSICKWWIQTKKIRGPEKCGQVEVDKGLLRIKQNKTKQKKLRVGGFRTND